MIDSDGVVLTQKRDELHALLSISIHQTDCTEIRKGTTWIILYLALLYNKRTERVR